MSHYHLIGQLPHHQYVHVDTGFTHRTPEVSSITAIWFGLVSYPGRAWGCIRGVWGWKSMLHNSECGSRADFCHDIAGWMPLPPSMGQPV